MHSIKILSFVTFICLVSAQLKWTEKASMPIKRSDFTANTVGDLIIVVGGCDSDQVCPEDLFYCYCPTLTNKTDAYMPLTNSWKSLPDMPRPRHRHSAAVVGQSLYVFGGRDLLDNVLTEVDVFDVSTNKWTTLSNTYNFTEPTSDSTASVVGSKIYNIGGYLFDYTSSNKTSVLDTSSGVPVWRYEDNSMKVGRGDACSGTYQDKIIVVGGFSEENFCKPLNSVEIYDPVTKTWQTGPSFEVARGDAACVVVGSKFHLLGGESKNKEVNCSKFSVVLHDIEIYNQDAKSWSFETDLVVNRFRFAASAWRNQFFIFGGQSGSVNESFPVLNTVTSYEDLNEVVTTGTQDSGAFVTIVSTIWLFVVTFVIATLF